MNNTSRLAASIAMNHCVTKFPRYYRTVQSLRTLSHANHIPLLQCPINSDQHYLSYLSRQNASHTNINPFMAHSGIEECSQLKATPQQWMVLSKTMRLVLHEACNTHLPVFWKLAALLHERQQPELATHLPLAALLHERQQQNPQPTNLAVLV